MLIIVSAQFYCVKKLEIPCKGGNSPYQWVQKKSGLRVGLNLCGRVLVGELPLMASNECVLFREWPPLYG